MAKFLNNIDLNKNEIRNVALQNLGTVPESPVLGQVYFDTALGNVIRYYDGSSWVTIGAMDADLDAIAALTGTGVLSRTGTNTWTLNTEYVSSVNGASGAVTGIAVTGSGLSQFASTTSADLAGVLSDETGYSSGAKAVFSISPSIGTSITTTSTSFDLLNTTAETVNFAGGATAVNIGNVSGTVTIAGNLTVNGTTTTINSTTTTVDDKNLELGSTESPSDTTADGGGITLKGTTDKTIIWANSTDSWTFNQNIDLGSGYVLKINGTEVLSATNYTGTAAYSSNLAGASAGVIPYQATTGSASTAYVSPPALGNEGYDKYMLAYNPDTDAPYWLLRRWEGALQGSGNTSYTVYAGNHGLTRYPYATRWAFNVSVFESATGDQVYPDVTINQTSGDVTFSFGSAIPSNSTYFAVITL